MKFNRLLIYLEDASLEPLVRALVEGKRLDVHFAARGEELFDEVRRFSPMMLIVDMTGFDTGWLFRHISNIKGFKHNFPIVAFVDTDEEATLRRLESAGCNAIFQKGQLAEKLDELIEKVLDAKNL